MPDTVNPGYLASDLSHEADNELTDERVRRKRSELTDGVGEFSGKSCSQERRMVILTLRTWQF